MTFVELRLGQKDAGTDGQCPERQDSCGPDAPILPLEGDGLI